MRHRCLTRAHSGALLQVSIDLDWVCAFSYEASVGNDNAVRIGRVVIDIPPGPSQRGYAKAKVEVRQLLDGSRRVRHQGVEVAGAVIRLRP